MPVLSGIRLATPLGDVQLTARSDGASPAMVSLRADGAPPLRPMPEGMRLDGGALVLCEGQLAAGASLSVSMRLDPARGLPPAEPNCGEHLDCVMLASGGRHLALATRDSGWMQARFPGLGGHDVRFTPLGLEITAEPPTSGARFVLPLALAWASGPDPLAVWFGVDAILPD